MTPVLCFPHVAVLLCSLTCNAPALEPYIKGADAIAHWRKNCEDVRSVSIKFTRCVRNDVFHTIEFGQGEILITDSGEGHFKSWPSSDADNQWSKMPAVNGRPHQIKTGLPWHWRWEADRFLQIDKTNKQYDEICYTDEFVDLPWGHIPFFSTLGNENQILPFVPGRPSQAALEQYTFRWEQERDGNVFILATPPKSAPRWGFWQPSLNPWRLCFKKDDGTLWAIQNVDPTSRVTYIFGSVRFDNSPLLPTLDLTGYTHRDSLQPQD